MTTEEFIFNTPLYQKVKVPDNELGPLTDLCYSNGRVVFDGYNPIRKAETSYKVSKGLYGNHSGNYNYTPFESSEFAIVSLACGRYGDILTMYLFLDSKDRSVTKIGQYPSIASIHIGQIKQYKSVLSDETLKEFTRAIGLAANGVGIGSFVYLRRIFEALIFEIAKDSISSGAIDESSFKLSRMDEKISLIKDVLPSFLVENKSIYGILSKGIHELSEEECLLFFDVMRSSIELILDEMLEAKEKQKKEQRVKESISKISSAINKK